MLLCMRVLFQGLDSSIQTEQSFELHVLEEDISDVFNGLCIFIDAVIFLVIISKRILNDSIFQKKIFFSSLCAITLSTRVFVLVFVV